MSTISQSTSNRSRNQNRKKANEDASYIGSAPSNSAGVKRQAVDRVDDASRAKRKKVESIPMMHSKFESENRISMVDFVKMPTLSVLRYLSAYDLVPSIRPLPSSADEPPPPYSLMHYPHPPRAPSPVPVTTPANRPRRDPNQKDQSRRRSSRLSEEENFFQRTPVLADTYELHVVLAGLAERHFRETTSINGREEIETLTAFMVALEKKSGRVR
ncbi:hypothetical protein BDP27DRAFT_1222248 [Rhodocollybia butyracea]|uniref:Histone deacetylase complex subunit SAP30 Sin3 binding domain-containing protein n=1 Tax=Rhodocollybia butyracea TaxID=206335 RepID=A0A9P5PPD6_9AGAR|nr:hypothetical protein BDP27DRAFT_1222248 [Rhodocollybia butyracea]